MRSNEVQRRLEEAYCFLQALGDSAIIIVSTSGCSEQKTNSSDPKRIHLVPGKHPLAARKGTCSSCKRGETGKAAGEIYILKGIHCDLELHQPQQLPEVV
eukprot:749539-Hanusia_phi.AAC.2